MSTMKDGGPAYPVTEMQAVHAYAMAVSQEAGKVGEDKDEAYIAARGAACTGMTLRDHFAGLAMQGDWATQGDQCGAFGNELPDSCFEKAAILYYRMADAMLKARNGGGEG